MPGKEAPTTTSLITSLATSVLSKHTSPSPQKIEETAKHLQNAQNHLYQTLRIIEDYFPEFSVPEYQNYDTEIRGLRSQISKLQATLDDKTSPPSRAGLTKALREAKEYERKSLALLEDVRPRSENATKVVYPPNDTLRDIGCPPKHIRDALAAWRDPAPKRDTVKTVVTQPEPSNDDDEEIPLLPISTVNDSLFLIGCPPKSVRDAVDRYKGPLEKYEYRNKLMKRLGLPYDETINNKTTSGRGSVKFPSLFDYTITPAPSIGPSRQRASSL